MQTSEVSIVANIRNLNLVMVNIKNTTSEVTPEIQMQTPEVSLVHFLIAILLFIFDSTRNDSIQTVLYRRMNGFVTHNSLWR